MTTAAPTGYINVGEAMTARWPSFLPQLPEGTLFDHLWAGALSATTSGGVVRVSAELLVEEELVLSIPGVDAVGIAIAAAPGGGTMVPVEVTVHPTFSIRIADVPVSLRLKGDLFRPARREPGASADPPRWVADTSKPAVDIQLARVTVTIDGDGDIAFELDGVVDLPPCMIGDSGVVVEAHDVALHLSAASPPPGQPAGWRGIHIGSASLHLPGELSATVGALSLTDAYIGNGGFTGAVSSTWTPALTTTLFGLDVSLQRAEIDFVQNAPVACSVGGTIVLPFFDQAVGVDLNIGLDGSLGVAVSATQPPGASSAGGLLTITKAGVLSMRLDSLGFLLDDGVFTARMSGVLTPLIGGLDWPGVELKELSIDSDGNVRVDGGWINLPSQYSLDFYGFQVAMTRLGIGSTDDGGRFIGFSGSIKLVDGIGIGGSVDGLRILWYDDGRAPRLTLDGVGVELDIPGTLRFKGTVSYHELNGQHRFDGDITLELLAIGLVIDGKIVIGTDMNAATGETCSFFALYIGVELPAGIPLWATGLGLYGIAGLVAIQMVPNKGAAPNALHPQSRTDEEWFENADGSPGWYKRPTAGVTDLRTKWDPRAGAMAFGAGVTIGTVADNGFTFSGKVLLVVSFPGPVILLEGKANILRSRASLGDDPMFRALVVLDVAAGNLLVGLDAQYKYGAGGELIEIGGSAEAFFDFVDPSRWHLYLGKDAPTSKRIRAQVLSLFEANSYFMLDANSLRMGAWIGYDKHWRFGPLSVTFEAWIEGAAALSFKPIHLHGELWAHGKAELSVFGFGLGLHIDARLAADVFDPFHLKGEFSVGISLPWPLPDFDVSITLEWGPTPDEPPLPMALKEIAVEHFKSTASWPLPRGQLLLPAGVDAGDGFLPATIPTAPGSTDPGPAVVPVVPMDARPRITFGRAVHDAALVGVNPQPVWPNANPVGWERIGDPSKNQGPMRVRFSLVQIVLSRWNGTSWVPVARKASDANAAGVKQLYGSWAPTPQLPAGTAAPGTDPAVSQTKLWLWSKTPFDHSRHGGREWDEWFTDAHPSYPCVPPVRERTVCCSFDRIPAGADLLLPHVCADHPEIVFIGIGETEIERLAAPVHGHVHALCVESPSYADISAKSYVARSSAVRGQLFGVAVVGDPASHMTLTFAGGEPRVLRRCGAIDLPERPRVKRIELPHDLAGARLSVFDGDGDGAERPSTPARRVDDRDAADVGASAEITLPCPATRVTITLMTRSPDVRVVAVDVDGDELDQGTPATEGWSEVTVVGDAIASIVVTAPKERTWLAEVCWECVTHTGPLVEAVAVDATGQHTGPYPLVGDTIDIAVPNLRGAIVRGRGHVCLVEACVTFPPSGAEIAARQDMAERLEDSLALWGQTGEVLEAFTRYALAVTTKVEAVGEGALAGTTRAHEVVEVAYFRTEGPPGLVELRPTPGFPNADNFDAGLDDLKRYVRQTVPPTVPPPGQSALLPRPVYRAYDVGVEFNEDYVDLLYRLARRDLYLYLYDANNQPVRDAQGRLVVTANRWGHAETTTLTEGEIRHVGVWNSSSCVTLDEAVIARQVTLFASDPGLVLDPDIVYEARLVPLLAHEDFSDGLAGWTIVDGGANQGPSAWSTLGHPTLSGTGATVVAMVVTLTGAGDLSRVDPKVDVVILGSDTARQSKTYRVMSVDNATKKVTLDGAPAFAGGTSAWSVPGWGGVTQTSNIWGGSTSEASLPKPGTMLVGGDTAWTDYRFTVQLRSADDAIGVVFRYRDANRHYRFSMDRERRYRRLVRVSGGAVQLLASDDFVFTPNQDYVVSVEAIGDWLRVYQDGALVFDVRDATHPTGGIGLYCWANTGARFTDVRIDDFRAGAPVAYRFSFTTSDFASFFHQVHAHDEEVWRADAVTAGLGPDVAGAVPPPSAAPAPVADAEARAFDALATKALGTAAAKHADPLEAIVVGDGAGGANGSVLLVRGPEPIDWTRTTVALSVASGEPLPATVPGVVKITDLQAGGASVNDDAVTLLARDRTSLAGATLEQRTIRGPVVESSDDTLLDEDFSRPAGILFEEVFDASALDSYRIVDAPGATSGPSAWSVSGGAIVQTSNIWSGSIAPADAPKLGTVAITGDRWANVRIDATLRSYDDDAIGIVFRWSDAQTWYRFSMDRERAYRRLVRCVGGTVTVLWEDSVVYDAGRAYALRIEAFGSTLVGFLDEALLFCVTDDSVPDGQVGLYCWANTAARFEALRVSALEQAPVLFAAPLTDAAELAVVDAATTGGPSAWSVAGGQATQTSNIGASAATGAPPDPGTVALLAPSFGDHRISVRLSSGDDDGMGVVFRYVDDANWYRFSMNRQAARRVLVRCVDGTATVLWSDATAFVMGHTYALTLLAEGERLAGWLDGTQLFDVHDDALAAGRVGFYCWSNVDATFSDLVVTDPVRRVGRWMVAEPALVGGPSRWRIAQGVATQRSNAWASGTTALGPTLVAGEGAWSDYRVEARLRSDDDGIGLVFRWVGPDDHYRLALDAQQSFRRLVQIVDGVPTVLWQDTGSYTVGTPFTLTIDAVGDRLVGYQDGQLLFDVVDSSLTAGRIGLYCRANTGARWERVTVTTPPTHAYALFADRFAAGSMAGFTIVDEGATSGPSAWAVANGELRQSSNIYGGAVDPASMSKRGTVALAGSALWRDVVVTARLRSTDDDAIGVVFRYADADNFYRFSMDRERSYRRLSRCVAGTFETLWETGDGYVAGTSYDVVIAATGDRLCGWLDGVPLFEVEDGSVAAGRVGLYCWANVGAHFSAVRVYPASRLAAPLLADDFAWQTAGLWTYETAGTTSGPAAWSVVGGEMRQTSNVWGDGSGDGADPAKPGTVALAGDPSLADCRVTARLASDDDDAIGVVARWQDGDNFYRFSMDRQRSYRRLVKVVDGVATTLWEDGGSFQLGRDHLVTLDLLGDGIAGYVDGVRLFAVRDSSVAAGKVGLYCWANTGARFKSFRLDGAGWSRLARFGADEPMLAAGTRVIVHAGNASAWTAAPPTGVTHRFLATMNDVGRRRFSTVLPTALRITLPDGAPGVTPSAPGSHSRWFLPALAFAPLPGARILRRADGTAFALALPDAAASTGSRVPAGTYRFVLTYRRDNSTAMPGSTVLRQAGDRSNEVVTLDLGVGSA